MTIPILHLDDDFVAVDKPAGLTVHRDRWSGRDEDFLLQAVSDQIGRFVYPVHRLDRNTSGVVCFALSSDTARSLQAALALDSTRKVYLTLARGETPRSFVSDRPLTNDHGERSPAHSEFERLATFSRCSLLAVRITTGRHHQIRRHLNHLAHHVIGDTTHGKGRINTFFRTTYGLPRMFLHAWRLTLLHPRTSDELRIVAPLPTDLRVFVERLPDFPADLLI